MTNPIMNYLCSVESAENDNSPFINAERIKSKMTKESSIETLDVHLSAEIKRIMDMLRILQ